MLKILHKGIQASLNLDQSGLTGDVEQDSKNAYVMSLVGGRLVSLDASANVQLADGEVHTTKPIGFVINDANGYFYQNIPAAASGKVPVTVGNCIVITDQLADGITVVPGELLYAGTGADVGKITNIPPDPTSSVVGVAASAASPAEPELQIIV